MALSVFGGDPRKSHFAAGIRADQKLDRVTRREQYLAAKQTLAAAGFPPQKYFEFFDKDAAGRVAAEQKARDFAAKVEKKTGVKLEVYEGCFL